jgi:flagellin-like protein
MKGITPIISIIILLLITVGLAAAAWTYMGNYFTSITAKTVEIPTQKCINGNDVMIVVHNMGTEDVNVTNDMVVLSGGTAVPSTQINWCGVDEDCASDTKTIIEPGGFVKAVIFDCTGVGVSKTCVYDFVVAGRTQTATVYCPG